MTYSRRASGILRQATLGDLFLLGLGGAIIFFGNYFMVPLYMALLPGANFEIALLLAPLFAVPGYFVYAGLGTAMPRAGGDYLYQSRALSPAIAFPIVIGLFVLAASTSFVATGVLAVADLMGLYPVFLFGGLSGIAAWISSSYGLFTVGIVFVILAIIHSSFGLKYLARFQRYITVPVIIISGITIPAILAMSNPGAFHVNFDHYSGIFFGNSTLYESISNGFTPAPFDAIQTIALALVLGPPFCMFSILAAPLLGEVKGAKSFKGVWWAYFLGGTLGPIAFLLPEMFFLQRGVGNTFLQAASTAGVFGTVSVPFYPTFGILTDMATKSYGLIVLASLAYIVMGYYIVVYNLNLMSRVWLAVSLDGMIPSAMYSTSRRTHSPIIGLVVSGIIISAMIAVEAFVTNAFTSVSNVAIYTTAIEPLFTSLAALFLPFRQKKIWESAPIRKFKGLLAINAVILVVLTLTILYSYAFYPPLVISLAGTGYTIIGILIVGSIAWFFLYRAYQKSKGVDVGLAFRELPAELDEEQQLKS